MGCLFSAKHSCSYSPALCIAGKVIEIKLIGDVLARERVFITCHKTNFWLTKFKMETFGKCIIKNSYFDKC